MGVVIVFSPSLFVSCCKIYAGGSWDVAEIGGCLNGSHTTDTRAMSSYFSLNSPFSHTFGALTFPPIADWSTQSGKPKRKTENFYLERRGSSLSRSQPFSVTIIGFFSGRKIGLTAWARRERHKGVLGDVVSTYV